MWVSLSLREICDKLPSKKLKHDRMSRIKLSTMAAQDLNYSLLHTVLYKLQSCFVLMYRCQLSHRTSTIDFVISLRQVGLSSISCCLFLVCTHFIFMERNDSRPYVLRLYTDMKNFVMNVTENCVDVSIFSGEKLKKNIYFEWMSFFRSLLLVEMSIEWMSI